MVKAAKAWLWSSYLSTIGQEKAPDFLDVEWLLSLFAKRKSTAIERYIQFVAEGKGQVSPWSMLKNQIYLGSEDFVEQMQSLLDGEKELSEVPSSQMRPIPKTLDYYEKQSNDRNSAIISGYRSDPLLPLYYYSRHFHCGCNWRLGARCCRCSRVTTSNIHNESDP